MRESFVFHAEYIADLPEANKADFTNYTVQYGLYGKEPPLVPDTLEYALWVKIARRIDAESEKYRAISDKRRQAAKRRYAQGGAIAEKAGGQAEQKERTQTTEKPKAARFEKPAVEEVAAYCEERRNGIDARAFFDFYESKGWKVGNQQMKDWRACIRTWEQRKRTESTGGRNSPGAMWGSENEIPDEIAGLF